MLLLIMIGYCGYPSLKPISWGWL